MHSNTYRKHYRAQFSQISNEEECDSVPVEHFRDRLRRQRGSLQLNNEQISVVMQALENTDHDYLTLKRFEDLVTSKSAQPSQIRRALYTIADGVVTPYQRVDVHSYIDEYTLCPPPIFILLISILEVAVFFYYYFNLPKDSDPDIWTYCAGCHQGNNYGIFIYVPKLKQQVWRFFSYAFLHAGLQHLLGNVFIQLLVGIPLEVVHKMWRIAPLYILAVILGAMLQYSVDSSVLLVGASAGVYALITAHLANVFLNWSEMPFRWVRISILGVFLLYDIGGTLYRRYVLSECDAISHAAHIAGGVTGFCFGVFVLYNIVKHTYESIVRVLCVIGFVVLFVGTSLIVILRAPNEPPLIPPCLV